MSLCIFFFSTSDIICNVPSIPNGVVRSSQKTYRESEQLHYVCNKGYTYGERADAQCTESGWSPTPYCTGQPFSWVVLNVISEISAAKC